MIKEERILYIAKKILYLARKHKLKTIQDIKKYIYTHDFEEDYIMELKEIFNVYCGMHFINCILSYKKKDIRTEELLVKRIKGVA